MRLQEWFIIIIIICHELDLDMLVSTSYNSLFKGLPCSLHTHLLYSVGTALLVGRSRDRFPVVSLGIFSVTPPDGTKCPEVDSASESEYQRFSVGVKVAKGYGCRPATHVVP